MRYAGSSMFTSIIEFIVSFDKRLFFLINSQWANHWGDIFFPNITDLHKTFLFKVLIVPALIAIFIWRRGLRNGLVIFFFCILSLGISDGVGNFGFKKVFQRPRPAETQGLSVNVRAPFGGYSFVSNHAINMFGFASFTSIIFPPAVVPVYLLASIIGYSRIYCGVHFPSDVIVGGILGIIFGVIFSRLCKMTIRYLDSQRDSSKGI